MTIRRCLALALLSCTGCFHLPTEEPAPVAPRQPVAAVPAGPVLPDQVTTGNAHQAAESLRQELDRASNQ